MQTILSRAKLPSISIIMVAALLSACRALAPDQAGASNCDVQLIILGAGQDAGAPQIGNPSDPAWQDPALRQTATSIAIVNRRDSTRYLFEPTPNITEQIQLLDSLAPSDRPNLGLTGVFTTHAHIGHYAGLMFFGKEAASTSELPVYAMPRMADYLTENGPWSQLVSERNIRLIRLSDNMPTVLSSALRVTPHRVPHRDEFSETVGYSIETDGERVFFVPDIDSWETWERTSKKRLVDIVTTHDYVLVDATFFDDNELPGRDMSKIPHPRVRATMDKLSGLSSAHKARVFFIHYNHTNPIRYDQSDKTKQVLSSGFNIARQGDVHCLADDSE